MKLSEMNAAELTKALCEIAAPIGNIAQDDEVVEALKKINIHKKNNAIVARVFGSAYAELAPLLLKKHKDDTFAVLSYLTGKTAEALEQENGFQLIRDVRSVLTSELLSFFGSSVDMA